MTIKAEIRALFLRAKDTKGRQQTRRRQARGTARLPVTVLRGATCRTSTPDFLSPERQGDIFLLSDQKKKRLTLGQKLRLETHILIFENPPCPEGASSLESHFPHSRATRLRLTRGARAGLQSRWGARGVIFEWRCRQRHGPWRVA